MDTATILFVFSVINGLICVFNFMAGRRTAGQEEGRILANLDSIRITVNEVKADLKDAQNKHYSFDERLTKLETLQKTVLNRLDKLEGQ